MTETKPEKQKDRMRTPGYLFDILNREFGPFDLDACAGPENALCDRYMTREVDVRQQDLSMFPAVFWNPPYSGPKPYVKKAYETHRDHGTTQVMLIPGSTSVEWWRYVREAAEIRFIEHRISFLDHNGDPQDYTSRQDSVIAIFRKMSLWERIKRWLTGPLHTYAEYREPKEEADGDREA